MTPTVDHLVVGAADLDTGIEWVRARLGVAPVFGGVHDGSGTRNALIGLGGPYLEVLALDPAQHVDSPSMLRSQLGRLVAPELMTVAVGRAPLAAGVAMSRVRPDGVRLEWELEFTDTPLFFIDWKGSPRPGPGLPDGGRITSLTITTPDVAALAGVEGVNVIEGEWRVEASIDGKALA